jgi:hypothetical protein
MGDNIHIRRLGKWTALNRRIELGQPFFGFGQPLKTRQSLSQTDDTQNLWQLSSTRPHVCFLAAPSVPVSVTVLIAQRSVVVECEIVIAPVGHRASWFDGRRLATACPVRGLVMFAKSDGGLECRCCSECSQSED